MGNPTAASPAPAKPQARAPKTKSEVIRAATEAYLSNINPDSPPPPAVLQGELMDTIETAMDIENAMRGPGPNRRWRIPHHLPKNRKIRERTAVIAVLPP